MALYNSVHFLRNRPCSPLSSGTVFDAVNVGKPSPQNSSMVTGDRLSSTDAQAQKVRCQSSIFVRWESSCCAGKQRGSRKEPGQTIMMGVVAGLVATTVAKQHGTTRALQAEENSTTSYSGVECRSGLAASIESVDIDSPTTCWASCRATYGEDNVVAATFMSTDASCVCHDACFCADSQPASTTLVLEGESSPPAASCDEDWYQGYWCRSELNEGIVANVSWTPQDCWDGCYDQYADELVAIDYHSSGSFCFCQNACSCLEPDTSVTGLIVQERDITLPTVCGFEQPEAADDAAGTGDDVNDELPPSYVDDEGTEPPSGAPTTLYDGELAAPNQTVVQVLEDAGFYCLSSLNDAIRQVSSPEECWVGCLARHGDELVAADYYPLQQTCWCQNACWCACPTRGVRRNAFARQVPETSRRH